MRPFHGQIYGDQFGNMKMYEFYSYSARGEFLKQVVTNYVYYAHVQSKTKTSDLQLNTITICSISDGSELVQGSNRVHSLFTF